MSCTVPLNLRNTHFKLAKKSQGKTIKFEKQKQFHESAPLALRVTTAGNQGMKTKDEQKGDTIVLRQEQYKNLVVSESFSKGQNYGNLVSEFQKGQKIQKRR